MERPILFKGEMVRAILEGRKTQTRRVIKGIDSECDGLIPYGDKWQMLWNKSKRPEKALLEICDLRCPYGKPGDQLLVASEMPDSPNDDYCAGTDGRIYSRTKYAGFGRKKRCDWYPLAGSQNSKGYLTVSLCHNNKKITKTVHQLICRTFYGRPPSPSHQVRHIDGDRANSAPINLCWGTQIDNWRDRKAHGRGSEGEKHHAAVLSDAEREHLRWAVGKGLCSQRHASRALGITQGAISALMTSNEGYPVEQDIPPGRIPEIWLEITDVRVERVNQISEEDAKAEGVEKSDGVILDHYYQTGEIKTGYSALGCGTFPTARAGFKLLWNVINHKRGYGWETNPFVWVISFRRIEKPAEKAGSFPRRCTCGSVMPDFLCVDANTATVAKCRECAEVWMREKGIGKTGCVDG